MIIKAEQIPIKIERLIENERTLSRIRLDGDRHVSFTPTPRLSELIEKTGGYDNDDTALGNSF